MQVVAPFLLSLVIMGPQTESQSTGSAIVIQNCQLVAIRDVQIPARQPGVLADIMTEDGVMVEPDQQMAQVDDREAKLRLIAAQREYEAAAEQAAEDVDVQAAKANRDVADAEVKDFQAINKRQPGAISPTEMRRTELTAKRAALQIRVAEMEYKVAGRTAEAKQAMVGVGQYDIDSRKILAPFAGLVVERFRQPGEWVQAGDPVMRLVQMDRLRVQGTLEAAEYSPNEIEGRRVDISITLPRGERYEVQSVVGYVSQVFEIGQEYRVWAEIDNIEIERRDERTFWKMRPGMFATMVIDMSGAAPRR